MPTQQQNMVPVWLAQEGLQKYQSSFQQLSEAEFLSLYMKDYADYGVNNSDDTKKLFRLINQLKKSKDYSSAGDDWYNEGHGQELLGDIYENDDISDKHRFKMSPVNNSRNTTSDGVQAFDDFDLDSLPDPPKIRVVVRKRPMMQKELERNEEDITFVEPETNTVIIHEPKLKVDLTSYTERHRFVFDDALAEKVSNNDVYKSTVQPLVHTVFKKGKATCFAYGQTGSGKTYTMGPLPVRAAADIFRFLSLPRYQHLDLVISCFEIYGGKLYDLLNSKEKLECLEDGRKNVCIKGLKEFVVDDMSGVEQLIKQSESCRSTGTTGANDQSSRSHSIMQFALKDAMAGPNGKVVGKISFIDLAGSERGADTFDNDKQTRLEGAEINKSLLALKECIRALDMDQRHIPFRGSKLTEVLRDSFQGAGARLVMIGNISPNSTSCEHSLNTLRYADRVKELRKDRQDRTVGGVTPGVNGYNNPSTRGRQREKSSSHQQSSSDRNEAPSSTPPSQTRYEQSKHVHKRAANSKDSRDQRTAQRVRTAQQEDENSDCITSDHADISADLRSSATGLRTSGVVGQLARRGGDQISARSSDDGDAVNIAQNPDEYLDDLYQEEDDLIQAHRDFLEQNMVLTRQDMALMQYVDGEGSSLEGYVSDLRDLLQRRMQATDELSARLERLSSKLQDRSKWRKTQKS